MYNITFKVDIQYSKYSDLKTDLKKETAMKLSLGRPSRQARSPHEIVRIIVKTEVTGRAQEEMVTKTIEAHDGVVIKKDTFGKSVMNKISDFFIRFGIASIFIYAAILSTVITYDPNGFFSTSLGIILVIVTIPVSIGVAATSAIKPS